MATVEQLAGLDRQMWILIFERIKAKEYLKIFRRYKSKLVFAGSMKVPRILVIGRRYFPSRLSFFFPEIPLYMQEEAVSQVAASALCDRLYDVVDWFRRKGRLVIYVTKRK